MNRFMKMFGYCSVAVYKEGNKWNLTYSLEESYRGKNPTKDDIKRLDETYSNINKTRELVRVLMGWVDQHHKGYVSADEFEQKMSLYFDE